MRAPMSTRGPAGRGRPVSAIAGGQMRGGRTLDYLGKPNRKMCSLYLAMMDKMGARLEQFGDSRERLAEI